MNAGQVSETGQKINKPFRAQPFTAEQTRVMFGHVKARTPIEEIVIHGMNVRSRANYHSMVVRAIEHGTVCEAASETFRATMEELLGKPVVRSSEPRGYTFERTAKEVELMGDGSVPEGTLVVPRRAGAKAKRAVRAVSKEFSVKDLSLEQLVDELLERGGAVMFSPKHK
jgi:hypothetical protein